MKKVLVYGLKKSGEAVVEFLHGKYELIVYDDSEKNIEEFEKRNSKKFSFEILKSINQLKDIDFAVISPAIPLQNKLVEYLVKNNIKVENELDFAAKFVLGNIIAVTGTNGKSTVVSLIYEILKKEFSSCFLAGNIGVPLTSIIAKTKEDSNVVVETSSFQLEKVFNLKPKIAVFLNIAPDHILRHGNFENYFNSKKNIFKKQERDDYAVLNYDDEKIKLIKTIAQTFYFSLKESVEGVFVKNNAIYFKKENIEEKICFLEELNLSVECFLQNYLAAICACKLMKVKNSSIVSGIKDFKSLEHRYENFLTKNNVSFINDSKATNVASTLAAINITNKRCHLLLGGSDKGENFDELFKMVKEREIIPYIFGATKNEMIVSAKKHNVNFLEFSSFKFAVESAVLSARENEVVLLSPACASFDEFSCFEERGICFKEIVKSIYEKNPFC